MPNNDDKRMAIIRRIVYEQQCDGGLWVKPHTALQAYLQNALKRLHKVVLWVQIEDIERSEERLRKERDDG